MKLFASIASLLGTMAFSSCGNTAFIGHRVGYDINAEVKSDLSSPVSMNVGFESHSGVAVPPERSLLPNQLTKSTNIPQGDVLPTISRLSIERLTVATGANTTGTEFDFVTVTASGNAAINATKPASMAASAQESPSTPAVDAATEIATSRSSIP